MTQLDILMIALLRGNPFLDNMSISFEDYHSLSQDEIAELCQIWVINRVVPDISSYAKLEMLNAILGTALDHLDSSAAEVMGMVLSDTQTEIDNYTRRLKLDLTRLI